MNYKKQYGPRRDSSEVVGESRAVFLRSTPPEETTQVRTAMKYHSGTSSEESSSSDRSENLNFMKVKRRRMDKKKADTLRFQDQITQIRGKNNFGPQLTVMDLQMAEDLRQFQEFDFGIKLAEIPQLQKYVSNKNIEDDQKTGQPLEMILGDTTSTQQQEQPQPEKLINTQSQDIISIDTSHSRDFKQGRRKTRKSKGKSSQMGTDTGDRESSKVKKRSMEEIAESAETSDVYQCHIFNENSNRNSKMGRQTSRNPSNYLDRPRKSTPNLAITKTNSTNDPIRLEPRVHLKKKQTIRVQSPIKVRNRKKKEKQRGSGLSQSSDKTTLNKIDKEHQVLTKRLQEFNSSLASFRPEDTASSFMSKQIPLKSCSKSRNQKLEMHKSAQQVNEPPQFSCLRQDMMKTKIQQFIKEKQLRDPKNQIVHPTNLYRTNPSKKRQLEATAPQSYSTLSKKHSASKSPIISRKKPVIKKHDLSRTYQALPEPLMQITTFQELDQATTRLQYLELLKIQMSEQQRENHKTHSNLIWKPMRHQFHIREVGDPSEFFIKYADSDGSSVCTQQRNTFYNESTSKCFKQSKIVDPFQTMVVHKNPKGQSLRCNRQRIATKIPSKFSEQGWQSRERLSKMSRNEDLADDQSLQNYLKRVMGSNPHVLPPDVQIRNMQRDQVQETEDILRSALNFSATIKSPDGREAQNIQQAELKRKQSNSSTLTHNSGRLSVAGRKINHKPTESYTSKERGLISIHPSMEQLNHHSQMLQTASYLQQRPSTINLQNSSLNIIDKSNKSCSSDQKYKQSQRFTESNMLECRIQQVQLYNTAATQQKRASPKKEPSFDLYSRTGETTNYRGVSNRNRVVLQKVFKFNDSAHQTQKEGGFPKVQKNAAIEKLDVTYCRKGLVGKSTSNLMQTAQINMFRPGTIYSNRTSSKVDGSRKSRNSNNPSYLIKRFGETSSKYSFNDPLKMMDCPQELSSKAMTIQENNEKTKQIELKNRLAQSMPYRNRQKQATIRVKRQGPLKQRVPKEIKINTLEVSNGGITPHTVMTKNCASEQEKVVIPVQQDESTNFEMAKTEKPPLSLGSFPSKTKANPPASFTKQLKNVNKCSAKELKNEGLSIISAFKHPQPSVRESASKPPPQHQPAKSRSANPTRSSQARRPDEFGCNDPVDVDEILVPEVQDSGQNMNSDVFEKDLREIEQNRERERDADEDGSDDEYSIPRQRTFPLSVDIVHSASADLKKRTSKSFKVHRPKFGEPAKPVQEHKSIKCVEFRAQFDSKGFHLRGGGFDSLRPPPQPKSKTTRKHDKPERQPTFEPIVNVVDTGSQTGDGKHGTKHGTSKATKNKETGSIVSDHQISIRSSGANTPEKIRDLTQAAEQVKKSTQQADIYKLYESQAYNRKSREGLRVQGSRFQQESQEVKRLQTETSGESYFLKNNDLNLFNPNVQTLETQQSQSQGYTADFCKSDVLLSESVHKEPNIPLTKVQSKGVMHQGESNAGSSSLDPVFKGQALYRDKSSDQAAMNIHKLKFVKKTRQFLDHSGTIEQILSKRMGTGHKIEKQSSAIDPSSSSAFGMLAIPRHPGTNSTESIALPLAQPETVTSGATSFRNKTIEQTLAPTQREVLPALQSLQQSVLGSQLSKNMCLGKFTGQYSTISQQAGAHPLLLNNKEAKQRYVREKEQDELLTRMKGLTGLEKYKVKQLFNKSSPTKKRY